jgi:serine/threonine protein kinase/DNA-binding winged helix-turn-helix (wHTH) protein
VNRIPAEKPASGAPPGQRRWLFGGVSLDEASLELRVDDKIKTLERKPLEVLVHLLHHAGEVVTKEELIAACWPGRIVTETVLAKAVGKLRDALSDTEQGLIKTVHGYGYRLVAKVEIQQEKALPSAHFAFRAGDHPPGRPLWSLVQRLGTGGQGEAWLASHDKTREHRVFKFAIDQSSLVALKREITLFRFLNDSLGPQAQIVTLRDWNLEQSPCFLEADHIAGGSLIEWTERNGGLSAISLNIRLEIAAQVAEALAAVHSVGVLHKDLKPSNVLIQPLTNGGVRVLLADFGSGGVLDVHQLEALGITRMGFTKSIAVTDSAAGTPLYLAPEVLAGQPQTVKGDIYALGVMLYQLTIGEFRRGLSAGWERNVLDEVLRECIAEAAQGDAGHRLGDAGSLAHRLRSLDDERERRRIEAEALRKAKELEHALAVAKSSQAVAEFLSRDMFSVVGDRPLRDLTARELLQAASEKLADRFQDMPLAAAQLHAALGNAFWIMECVDEAGSHLDAALGLYEQLDMAGSPQAMPVAAQLMTVDFQVGKRLTMPSRYEKIRDEGRRALGPGHSSVLAFSQQLALIRFGNGEWRRSAAELQRLIADARASGASEVLDSASGLLGRVLISLGEYTTALKILQDASTVLKDKHGPSHVSVAQLDVFLAIAFTRLQRFPDAELALSRAETVLERWTTNDAAAQLLSVRSVRGQLRLAQGRSADAIDILARVLQEANALPWMHKSGFVGEIQTWLANAYLAAGRIDEALATMQTALSISESTCGARHPQTHAARIGLAEVLLRHRRIREGRAVLSNLELQALGELGRQHPLAMELVRVEELFQATERARTNQSATGGKK